MIQSEQLLVSAKAIVVKLRSALDAAESKRPPEANAAVAFAVDFGPGPRRFPDLDSNSSAIFTLYWYLCVTTDIP